MNTLTFQEQLERIKEIVAARTQFELANFLGIKQAELSDAMRREKIPSGWLIILMRVKNVHPEWVLTGKGPCFISRAQESGCYETGEAFAKRKADEEALRRLSSRVLADELVRRIAVAQEKSLCSHTDAQLDEGI